MRRPAPQRRRFGSKPPGRGIERLLALCSSVSVLTTLGLVLVLLWQGRAFFRELGGSELLTGGRWRPLLADPHSGFWPLLGGTLLVTGIALVIALPLGTLASLYLSEFSSARERRVLTRILGFFCAIPTVVYGYFALVVVTPLLGRWVPDLAAFNALSPGFVLGFVLVPLITAGGHRAFLAVPFELREAAHALGATRFRVIGHIILPAALPRLAAAICLAIARAVGETMIVTIAAGRQPHLTLDPRVPIETLTTYIVSEKPTVPLEYHSIFVVGAALFAITTVFNLLAHRLGRTSGGTRS